MRLKSFAQRGFTLIELLVVIGILAILLAITLVAINPGRNFAQARDTQRQHDVTAILDAVGQYMAANKGNPPTTITSTATNVGSGATDINLCTDLVSLYIADIPVDPSTGSESPANSNCKDAGATYNTGYKISKSATDNRITVSATGEITTNITVTR